jgi:hypothetical protein
MHRSLFCLIPIFLAQYQIDPVRPFEEMKLGRKLEARASEETSSKVPTAKRKEFEKKVNTMIQALSDFTDAYNKSMGRVWPAREAKALKKAILDLQQSETWFAEIQAK